MARVLVTGASGFLGRTIVPVLCQRHEVRAAARCYADISLPGQWVSSPDIGPEADWRAELRDIDVVVHLGALAHVPMGAGSDGELQLEKVNVRGTEALARQASQAGVRRFIFMSSIKAAGDHSAGCALRPDMPPAPEDAYGRAKLLAEQLLLGIAAESKLETVILRPPMVYGPQSKGNFALLIRWVRRGLPMPFGSVANRRSIVSVWNLAAVVDRCVDADVAGQILHVTDQSAISTGELVNYIAKGLGTTSGLFRMPPVAIRFCLGLIGRKDLARRLLDSLEVDGRLTNDLLSWQPELSTEDGIARAARESA